MTQHDRIFLLQANSLKSTIKSLHVLTFTRRFPLAIDALKKAPKRPAYATGTLVEKCRSCEAVGIGDHLKQKEIAVGIGDHLLWMDVNFCFEFLVGDSVSLLLFLSVL